MVQTLPPIRDRLNIVSATVSLIEQSVESGDQKLNLQSGMGVSANIKLRSRPVISIVRLIHKAARWVKRFR